jgi:large conductance mechanosensitive channel
MEGFKNFVLRGNLVELAVAFVMATAFAAVVLAMVDVLMDVIGRLGGTPDFSNWSPGGISIGALLSALIAFLVIAAVVYYFIVTPYTKAQEKYFPKEEPGEPADVALLSEIRDLIATGRTTRGTDEPNV